MPAYITHTLFGEDLYYHLSPDAQRVISRNREAYNWGLQGPDILFFRKVLSGGSPLNEIGQRLHKERTSFLFEAMVRYLTTRKGQRDEALLKAYLYGFVGHYQLDSGCHPYIYWMQEQRRAYEADREWVHHEIEGELDAALYRHRRYRGVGSFPYRQYFSISEDTRTAIALLYTYLAKEVLGEEITPGEVSLSIRDAISVCSLMLDRSGGLVLGAVQLWEGLNPKAKPYSSFIKKEPGYDLLNLQNVPWQNLQLPGLVRRESFLELMAQAAQSGARMAGQIEWALSGAVPYRPEQLVSFDAGHPV